MYRILLLTLIAFRAATPLAAQFSSSQQGGQLDGSPAIFAVMCAIAAGGYDQEINSPTNHQIRKALRDELVKKDLDSVRALKRFVRDHKPQNPSLELNQYISWALVSTGPPYFELARPNLPQPPDVVAMEGFGPLMAQFYKDADIGTLWDQAQVYHDQMIEKLSPGVSQAVLQVNSYLRNVTSGYLGRRFQIYVDLMGPPNQVQTRSYIDDYFVVVTPSAELPIEDIRHAYLHYLSDPLGIKFASEIKKKMGLIDYAQGSPVLANIYKEDFNILATESFIKAVEARIAKKPAMVTEALREGYVVTPAFADGLLTYEKQETAMRLYFPDLVSGIDLRQEAKRLENIDFVTVLPVKKYLTTTVVGPPALTGAAKTLDTGEQAYLARDLAKAKQIYLQVLKETEEKPSQAKAYYGLARVAVLERDPETGDRLFRKVLELEPDPSTKSWSLLYLGRLADSQQEREEAAKFYQAALAVEGAPESVRASAEKGLKEAFTKTGK